MIYSIMKYFSWFESALLRQLVRNFETEKRTKIFWFSVRGGRDEEAIADGCGLFIANIVVVIVDRKC